MSLILTVVFGLLGLGIIVLVHEVGHFAAAKAAGIHVEVFSLGWGGRLAAFEHRGTTYQVSWFPLGGYCKMKGEMLRGDMTAEEATSARTEPGAFLAAAPWRRIAVAVAGPMANFLFAVVVLTLIWWMGFRIHTSDNRIVLASDYEEGSYAADAAGLVSGDRIVAIDGAPVESFWHISEAARRNPGRSLDVTISRSGRLTRAVLVPKEDPESGLGRIGVFSWIDPIVGQIEAGAPADMAGLLPGDILLTVEGRPIAHEVDFYYAMERHLALSGRRAVEITYRRGSTTRTARLALAGGEDGQVAVGVSFRELVFRSPRMGPAKALATGVQRSAEIVIMSVQGIQRLFKMKDTRLNDVVAGPIRITRMVGEAATYGFRLGIGEGLVSFFQFVALLSIAIAIMNLLPLPALDGGLIAISAAEALARRPLAPKILWRFQIIGVIIIFCLIFLAITSDILSFVG